MKTLKNQSYATIANTKDWDSDLDFVNYQVDTNCHFVIKSFRKN